MSVLVAIRPITANGLWRLLLCSAALCLLAAAPSAAASAAGTTLTATGHIGPLQIDRSDRSAIVAFAGSPDAEETTTYTGGPPFDALGYGCDATPPAGRGIAGRECQTAFYVSSATDALVTFFTTAHGYRDTHGIHVGTRTGTAERLLHKRLIGGCETNFYIRTRSALFTIADLGGRSRPPNLRVRGGHIFAFVLHSPNHDLGLFDCL